MARRLEGSKEKQPEPHSEDSERAVLGAIIQFPDRISFAAPLLAVSDFYIAKHQSVYRAMVALATKEIPIDVRTVQAHLELHGEFDAVGGIAFLEGLDLSLPDVSRLAHYIEVMKERSLRRRLIKLGSDMVAESYAGGNEAKNIVERSERGLANLALGVQARGFVKYGVLVDEVLVIADDETKNKPLENVNTGFEDFDRFTRGLTGGQFIIIAGRPGMGKTSLAMNFAQNIAFRLRGCVGFASMEMSGTELTQRVLASEAGVPFQSIRVAELSSHQWERILEAARRTSPYDLWIDETPNMTMLELCSKARRMKSEHHMHLLIIDYLQLMRSGGRHENREKEIAEISRLGKQLAKELDIPIIALSQLSRQPERRGSDHRPQLSDLRESGSLEQDADIVCFVYRDEVYNPDDPEVKGKAELIFAKQRGGPTGTIDLVFNGETTTFKGLDSFHVLP